MGIQGVTRGYRGLKGVTRGYKRLKGVTRDYKGLQGVTRGYRGLQGITKGYRWLQGVKIDYRELQRITETIFFFNYRTSFDSFSCFFAYKSNLKKSPIFDENHGQATLQIL